MRPCPLCDNQVGLTALWQTNILKCPVCGFAFVAKLPSVAELEHIYSQDYFHGNTAYRDYVGDSTGLQWNFTQRIRTLRRFVLGTDMLEVGCAYGFFMQVAQQFWHMKGTDISADAITYARDKLRLDVQRIDFESASPEANAYDAVVMWDTIEHFYNPVTAIEKAAYTLRQGGILALTTGDIGAVLPQIQKQHWRLIMPSHLSYFSRESLSLLLARYGFQIVHYGFEANARSLRQMAHILTWQHEETGWRGQLVRWIDRLPFAKVAIPINTFDIMFVVARKK
jgi:2-polyprenyl-3-methyl-5-hydroxy-6-metoxy-1,4-benzoquinol methylase